MSSLAGKMQIWQSLTTIGVTALTKFIEDARPRNMSGGGIVTVRSGAAAPECDVLAQLEVIEPILDKFIRSGRGLRHSAPTTASTSSMRAHSVATPDSLVK